MTGTGFGRRVTGTMAITVYTSRISADGFWLIFNSNRSNGYGAEDIWQVSIDPVVDLNSDGIVDALDMCIVVDHWGTDNPLCDMGPMP